MPEQPQQQEPRESVRLMKALTPAEREKFLAILIALHQEGDHAIDER